MDAKDDISQCSLEIILCIVEPTRPCGPDPVCLPIPDDKLTDDDGATCRFTEDVIPCRWACNGTCTAKGFTVTEVGGVYISTEPSDTELAIEMYAKHFSSNLLGCSIFTARCYAERDHATVCRLSVRLS